jgi:hypothetical protein
MGKVYIGFSSGNSILSWLIKKIERTPFSHVYVRLPSPYLERDLYFQASSVMVNIMGKPGFDRHSITLEEFEIEISEETKRKVWQFAIDNSGKPYGILQLVGIGMVRLGQAFNKKWKNPFHDNQDSFICAEFVYDVLKEIIGADLTADPDSVGLKEIYEYIKLRSDVMP